MFRKLSSSLAWWTLGLVCLASFSLMFYAARTDSAIDDELAHIPAGYGYVSQLDYRLNPEHPPLVKALAMLPVLFLNPTFPTGIPAWTTEINGQWDMGTAFLYQSGNDANAIIQTARIMPILLTILTVILVYLLARRLMGRWWALLPAFLFAFDPTVLAHGHYVTTDVGAAFGVVLSLFFFLRFVDAPTVKNLWLAGLAFGIGQLTKFSLPLVTVTLIFLTLILWLRGLAGSRVRFGFWQLVRNLILIIAIGYVVVVYPVYFLFTVHYPIAKQVSDTTQILTSFATGPTPAGQLCRGMRCLADLDIWMAGNPVARPYGQYLLGLLMALQRSDGGNTIYFLGHVVNSGGWIYFPVLFLLKEPVPTLIIIFLAFALAVWWTIRRAVRNRTFGNNFRAVLDYLDTNFGEFSLASFIVLYWSYSMHSPLNIGIRHILPTLPLFYILAAGVWKRWITGWKESLFLPVAEYIFLVILLVWLALETLFAAPYFLSYFNEFAGGTANGYRYVTDSNYDWGQDLLRLQTFVAAHPEIGTIAVDYFGGGDPHYYLGAQEVDWQSSKGDPADQGIHWLAVSVNQLQGAIEPLVPGETRDASDTYAWLTALRPPAAGMGNVPPPDYIVGTSIFVYHL
ncbi:MAG TPA: phospholipid carrier-dependent glycosyltransferase [Candidatus Paceibacterota bacterium]|nr:phospholipid carrier-dependent glycosyltransferase [Candidatus Paceibacterota bacterium]